MWIKQNHHSNTKNCLSYNNTKEVLCNILSEIGIFMKLAGLTEMCLNESYNEICVSKYLPDVFPIHNGVK